MPLGETALHPAEPWRWKPCEESRLRYNAQMHRFTSAAILLAFVLVVAACSGDDGDVTTTTGGASGSVTTLPAASTGDGSATTDTTSVAAGATTTVGTAAGPAIPEFTILSRTPSDEGDTVVVLLDPNSYESLTDIDLQNVISEVVDDFPPVFEAHVIDDETVAPFLAATEVTADQQQLLNVHYLVRLDEGFRITFVGPFEDSGSTVLGS
jgi:hypothetical protein